MKSTEVNIVTDFDVLASSLTAFDVLKH